MPPCSGIKQVVEAVVIVFVFVFEVMAENFQVRNFSVLIPELIGGFSRVSFLRSWAEQGRGWVLLRSLDIDFLRPKVGCFVGHGPWNGKAFFILVDNRHFEH